MSTHLGHHLINERLDAERGVPPDAANMPTGGSARPLQVEGIDETVAVVAVYPQWMVEGLVEDPHRLDVLVRREVLVPKYQDLMGPEGVPQGFGGGVVDRPTQIDARYLGTENGAGREHLVGGSRSEDVGHTQILLIRSDLFNPGSRRVHTSRSQGRPGSAGSQPSAGATVVVSASSCWRYSSKVKSQGR